MNAPDLTHQQETDEKTCAPEKRNGDPTTLDETLSEFSNAPDSITQDQDTARVVAKLLENERLLQHALGVANIAAFRQDKDLRYTWMYQPQLGYTTEQVVGRTDPELLPAADAAVITEIKRRVLESGQSAKEETTVTMDNRTYIYEVNLEPVRQGDNVIGLIGSSLDITDRRRGEAELRLRDRALRAVSQGIVITDPSLPDNPIIYVSPSFERLTGYSSEEVIGRNCRFLQGKDTDAASAARIREAIRGGTSCTVELLNYRKDGTPFWNSLAVSPVVDERGRMTHFVGVQTDVTERRRMEDQFRQAQKMEALGQLAGGVAHDFNNLLTIINGYSNLLLTRLSGDDSAREGLFEIHKAGERASALTRQLLAFSRQQVMEPKVLNLNTILSDIENMIRRMIGEDLILAMNLCLELGLVEADRSQIEQILLNLAVNARHAMPTGGSLIIETQNVELPESYCKAFTDLNPGEYVLLAVSDTGCGMDEATRERIFEPFFTTKGPDKGTGLGLAMVHGIVKQSRGHIAVYSEAGHGTTFKVYLPRVSEPRAAVSTVVSSQTMPLGTETILLVEDEDPVRNIGRQLLQCCGYKVLEAANGNEAVRLSESYEGRIHLLVSDVVMPHLGGRELAEQIVSARPECKVLFVSGYTDDAVIRHGILEEEYAFLQKPFTPSSLAQTVRGVLDNSQGLESVIGCRDLR